VQPRRWEAQRTWVNTWYDASHAGTEEGYMATSSLMIINIATPPTQMSRRARVDYAQRAVLLALQELIGVDSTGQSNVSLGTWAFDASEP
jgi:hypothetical protein